LPTRGNPFLPSIPEQTPGPGERLNWNTLSGSSTSLAAVSAACAHKGLTLLICPTTASARQSVRECQVFAPPGLEILHFPDWETLPFDAFSPHQDIISERLETMARLPGLKQGLLVVTLATCLQRTAPVGYVAGSSFQLAPGQTLDINTQRTQLVEAGYRQVSAVTERGEFAVRGALTNFPWRATPSPRFATAGTCALMLINAAARSIRT